MAIQMKNLHSNLTLVRCYEPPNLNSQIHVVWEHFSTVWLHIVLVLFLYKNHVIWANKAAT